MEVIIGKIGIKQTVDGNYWIENELGEGAEVDRFRMYGEMSALFDRLF